MDFNVDIVFTFRFTFYYEMYVGGEYGSARSRFIVINSVHLIGTITTLHGVSA